MTALKWLGGILILVVAGIMVVGLVRSDEWRVERSVVIGATPEQIQPYLVDFDQGWQRWWTFRATDPDATWEFGGTAGTPGHWMSWDGRKVGQGKQTLTSADVNTGIRCDVALSSVTPNIERSLTYSTEKWATRVTWRDLGTMSTGMGGPAKASMREIMTREIDASLAKLKAVVEADVGPRPIGLGGANAAKAAVADAAP